jgi:hypothetical protein
MQKLFLLLRSNRQSGPHTLDELVKMNLKPADLVWVEGKSHAWSYPHEVEELKHLFANAPAPQKPAVAAPVTPAKATVPKIFVSLPRKESPKEETPLSIEERADALRRRVEQFSHSEETPELNTLYSRSLEEVGENYGEWLTTQHKRKKSKNGERLLVPSLLIAAVLAGGWWVGRFVFNSQTFTLSQQSAMIPPPQKTVKRTTQPSTVAAAEITTTAENVPLVVDSLLSLPQTAAKKEKQKPQVKKDTIVPAAEGNAVAATPVASEPLPEQQKSGEEETQVVKTEEASAAKDPEKKKGLGKFFSGLFGKKKKAEEPTQMVMVDLKNDVELQLKNNDDNWMMGIQGVKLSLRNKSGTELKDAAVEIHYLSEDNTLLEKKTVHITNVSPRKTKTISLPDHRTAGRISYQLLSARGEEEAYVKQ